MQHRAIGLLTPLIFGLGFIPPAVQAQTTKEVRTHTSPAMQLELLSRERARHWAETAPSLRCAPAPLTERPTAVAEFTRPHVVPLEAAFLDAATVRRVFAARNGRAPAVN